MRAGYWLGGLLVLLAVASPVGLVVSRAVSLDDDIARWPKASLAEGTVQLEARRYQLYVEAPVAEFGWTLSVTGPDGRERTIDPTGSEITYDLGGRHGSLIGELDAAPAGEYRVRGTGPPDARVIFGDRVIGGFVRTMLTALALLLVLGAIGVGMIIRTAARGRPEEEKRWP